VCDTSNKLSVSACGACEEPRPAGVGQAAAASSAPVSTESSATPAAAAPSFTFGSAPASATTSTVAATFGAAASAPSSSTFSFGASEAAASETHHDENSGQSVQGGECGAHECEPPMFVCARSYHCCTAVTCSLMCVSLPPSLVQLL
jgi:hypothetical protein